MTIDEKIEAMTVITNIQAMRRMIGVTEISVEHYLSKSIEDLREEQDSTIKHYNEALKNRK
jgi:hypothetical protein